jgi:hypothetical protein
MKSEITSSIPNSKLTSPIGGRDHIYVPIDAPIALLEYGDYECPLVKAIQERLGNRLCFAFRNFPLVNAHPHAEHAAEAAEAAGTQGRFWEMHDTLFENQTALDDENLAQYAADLGLDARLINEVVAGAHAARVQEDFRSGARGGVNVRPPFINGMRYDGAPHVDALSHGANTTPSAMTHSGSFSRLRVMVYAKTMIRTTISYDTESAFEPFALRKSPLTWDRRHAGLGFRNFDPDLVETRSATTNALRVDFVTLIVRNDIGMSWRGG